MGVGSRVCSAGCRQPWLFDLHAIEVATLALTALAELVKQHQFLACTHWLIGGPHRSP